MAQRKKRRTARSSPQSRQPGYPGWAWMLFGLAIGLSVAFAIHVRSLERPAEPAAAAAPSPAPPTSRTLDDNGENRNAGDSGAPAVGEAKTGRFTFYEMLKSMEVAVPDERVVVTRDTEPQAVIEPGLYVLQAGSFSTHQDADRRRAELALQGIESHIQIADVNGRTYHRVHIGPTDDLDELNVLRSRLRAARIDVLRIRLGE